jgi:hypothetical protein
VPSVCNIYETSAKEGENRRGLVSQAINTNKLMKFGAVTETHRDHITSHDAFRCHLLTCSYRSGMTSQLCYDSECGELKHDC